MSYDLLSRQKAKVDWNVILISAARNGHEV
jgi:hypothetical protein